MKDFSIYKNKKVIVTGNTGFKGSWLTLWLQELGATVYGISKDVPTTPSLFEDAKLDKKITHHQLDIRNYEAMKKLFAEVKPDFVFHLAAQAIVSTSYQDPLDTFSSNVMGTANILEAVRHLTNPCVVVCVTSDKCYDNVEWEWGYRETDALGGKDIYSGSKGAAELVAKSYYHSFMKKTPHRICTVRAGNVLGGGDWAKDRIVPDCIRAWLKNEKVSIRNPKSTRPWQHVMEPLSGYLLIGSMLHQDIKLNGEAFNFGPNNDTNYSVEKLISDLAQEWKRQDAFEVIPSEKFQESNLLRLNCDKALLKLQWKPTLSYAETIKMISDWYQLYQGSKNNLAETLVEKTLSQIRHFQEKMKYE
jgi:CDP-glucose 4,6-dehydratase